VDASFTDVSIADLGEALDVLPQAAKKAERTREIEMILNRFIKVILLVLRLSSPA
jgi:hypothetical protein